MMEKKPPTPKRKPPTPKELSFKEKMARWEAKSRAKWEADKARREQEESEGITKPIPSLFRVLTKKEIPLETPEERAIRLERNERRRIEQEKHQAECDAKNAILEAERQERNETAWKPVPVEFLKYHNLTDRELKCYMGFLAFTNAQNIAFVGKKKLAETTKQSEGRIYQIINSLTQKGNFKVMKKEITAEGNTIVHRKAVHLPRGKWKKVEFQSKTMVKIPIAFLKHHLGNMTGREFQVFMALLALADGYSDVLVSNKVIQEAIGGSIKGIERAIKDLKTKGYVKDIGKDGHTKFRRLFFLPKIKAKENKIDFECPGKEFGGVFCHSYRRYEFCETCGIHQACWAANLEMINAKTAAELKAKKSAKFKPTKKNNP